MKSPPDDHDHLVQLIYDSAEDARGLRATIEAIGRYLGAEYGQLLLIQPRDQVTENLFFGYDPSSFLAYETYWRPKDPRFAVAIARPNAVHSDVQVIDPATFERSEIYNDHLKPTRARYTLFTTTTATPDLMLANAYLRTRTETPFGAEEVARLTALLPHLKRAARLRALVQSMQSELSDLRRALDTIPSGVAMLDALGKVVCTNGVADEIVREGDAVRIEKGVLVAARPREAKELSAAIAQAAVTADARASRPGRARLAPTVTIARSSGAALGVVLFTLRPRSDLREASRRSARILAVLHDPTRLVRLDAALLAKMHGLTATEAELAAALAEGKTLAEFAAKRSCTEQTARTHLKRILGKTGARRQADLVRMLLSGAAAHGVMRTY